jgi:peroxiredoxin Q/BCP
MHLIPTLRRARGALALAVLLLAAAVYADNNDEVRVVLNPGDRAPAFVSTDEGGKPWRLADHVGRRVLVLYFYLGDFMPDATKEALAFQKELGRLRAAGVELVGVSGDATGNHELFKKAHDLKFTLLSDEKGELCKQYGVARSGGGTYRIKDRQGQEVELERGVTPSRWLFVIGRDGKVAHRDINVNYADPTRKLWPVLDKLRAAGR